MNVVFAHDYLVQFGGAERVALSWLKQSPSSSLTTLAHEPSSTFPEFDEYETRPTIQSSAVAQRLEYALPVLPRVSARTKVPAADFAIASTSGWSHGFAYASPVLAYVHSPARWLHAADDFLKGAGRARSLGLRLLDGSLRDWDRNAMLRMDAVVANSLASQRRIREAYGLNVPIVHPPVEPVASDTREISVRLPERFGLVVSRARGYKNVQLAVAACAEAGLAAVVVGSGSEVMSDAGGRILGVGRVTDFELKMLYQRSDVIIGSAHEDFGLTVLEANLEGTPAAAISVGGYLETISEGCSGSLATEETPKSLGQAIIRALECGEAETRSWALRFSPSTHFHALIDIAKASA